ncbi:MAG: CapA family protein [Peptococcia bacterium]|jgi:poly-gamma-glutamate capsule biosynthesis protein CapA/YwtB (metallophosphatase superfamily)
MKKAILVSSLICLICFAALLFLFGQPAEAPLTSPLSSPPPPPPEKNIMISAVGDIMMHNSQIAAGYQPDTGAYDFSSYFRLVKPHLEKAHFVIGNLETTLGTNPAHYGGYPRFNSPAVLAENLKDAGFHLLTTANNHALDRGITGLRNTLQILDEAGLLHTGTARSQEEKETILITEIENVKTAILAYTYGTNGLQPPADHPFAVNYLDEDEITENIKKAREAGAQLIVLCLHFGQEYQNKPNQTQTALAQKFLQAGADIILGTHPHVLQPSQVCYLEAAAEVSGNGEGNEKRESSGDEKIAGNREKKFVSYSLGNFISDQNGLARRTAIILNLHLGVDSLTGKPYFKSADYIPIWTRKYIKDNKTYIEVVPIEQALNEIRAGKTTEYTPAEVQTLEQAWEHAVTCLATEDANFCLQQIK